MVLLALLQPVAPFIARACRAQATVRPVALRQQVPQRALRAGKPEMFGPGGGGGFLNMGTPELVVIGAVAWALLGPKELYRLARQAGEFIGEWQQLGAQARDTFKEAIESEMREEELKAKSGEPAKASPFEQFTPGALKEKAAPLGVPPLADYTEAKRKEREQADSVLPPDLGTGQWLGDLGRDVSDNEKAELYRKAVAEMGDPETNRKTFQEQINGERNAAVLEEFPQELNFEDWSADPLKPEEDLMDTQIQEAENQLATLRAEAKVLELRRKQQQANAERAQKLAEDAALAAAAQRADQATSDA